MRCGVIGVLWMLLGAAWSGALEVRFLKPDEGSPVFGQVEIEVEWLGETTGAEVVVELYVDEKLAARLDRPPYRAVVDVGTENRPHLFEAVVLGADGVLHRVERRTEAVQIHDQVQLDLQQVYVTVTRRNGSRVLDLENQDFVLRDAGAAQEIVTFERGDIPFTAILLVDTSETMRGSKLDAALRGVETFAAEMEAYDEAKVMLFSERLLAVSQFTSEAPSLIEGLGDVEATGGTALNDFLFLALRELDGRQGRRVVIVLSDGSDVHSLLDMDQVREVARRSQAQIFWVRLGDKRRVTYNSWRDPEAKEQQIKEFIQTVAESGGRQVRVSEVGKIDRAFQEILRELREQYALGYYPKKRFRDGRWRSLEVDVESRRLGVRTRGGYYDQ